MRLLAFITTLLPLFIYSQSNGRFVEGSQNIKIPYTITQYDTKDGLPQSQIIEIIPKKNGNLILLTANGIVEYNGIEFNPFIKNNNYKNYTYKHLIWHDKTNQLFAQGSKGSLHLVYPKHVLFKSDFISVLKNDSLHSIDSKGDIHATNVSNLSYTKIIETGIKDARCIYFNSHFYLIGTSNYLYEYDIYSKKVKEIAKGDFYFIKQNPYSKDVYAISNWKVYKISNNKTSCVFDVTDTDKSAVCQYIDFIDSYVFFVATHHGLYLIENGKTICYTKQDYLPSHYIQSLYFNKQENCLFLGSAEKGLLKLQLKNARTFYETQGIEPTTSLNSIIQTQKDGDILTSGNLGYIYKIGKDTTYHYTQNTTANGSLAEIDGVIYVGTWGSGVVLVKDRKIIGELKAPKQLAANSVHATFKDSQGRIWIGTIDGVSKGTYINNIKPFLTNDITNDIITFYELKNRTICVGGSNGVYFIDKNDKLINHISIKNGLKGKEVRCFYEDNEGKLWIGTYGGGLYCYHNNKLTSINAIQNAMLNNDVFCLAKDNLGYFYITSNHGLWRIKENDLQRFYSRKLKYLIPFYYGEETGILNTEFNGGFQNNYLKTKDNTLYFPSLQGVVLIKPEKLIFRKISPVIESVLINDSLLEGKNSLFNRNTYSIKFNFYAVNFLNKYNLYYQYKLENEKKLDWSPLQKEKSVSFKLLPPGKYTFSVRVIDGFNDENPTVTAYDFEIKPYFHETLWFKILCLIVLLILVVVISWLPLQIYRRKAEEKERVEKQIAQIELKAVQAQLNPHFIFNCINVIKSFILEKDFVNANEGLNKLSSLIRNSLEKSDQVFVPLEEELSLISNYIDLEKMRLQDQLTYTIKIDSRINSRYLIPHLLIQPHIENAIKHGISNLTTKLGILTIDVKQLENEIIFYIKDNGIGRKKANELNLKNSFHFSKGSGLSKEKSDLLNQYYNYACSIEITDLFSESNDSNGTLVIIKIPIEQKNYKL